MRFPSFPLGAPENIPPQVDKKENPLAHIPESARKKILRTLQGDLAKRGKTMDQNLKNDTLGTVLDLEEVGMEKTFGGPLVREGEADPVIRPEELAESRAKWKPQEVWKDTISLEDSAANESGLGEDKKLA